MSAGRPSSYDPSFCDQVIELGKKGMSVVEMAAELGVHRETLEENWPRDYPEFSEAFRIAKQCSQAWWESMGRVNLIMHKDSGTFNTGVWSRSMAARFPKDWREAKTVDLAADVNVQGKIESITRKIVKADGSGS